MILGTGCLADAALDGDRILAALTATRLDRVLLVAEDGAVPSALPGLPVAAVRVAWEDATRGVQVARLAGARRLVLEPPGRLEVEAACRALFALARSHPGLALAILPAADGALASPAGLQLVLEDLAALPLGYWHRPARAHLLGLPDSAWLDPLGRWLVGMSLDDVAGGEGGLPPGTGEIDFRSAAELTARVVEVALDTAPVPDPVLLRASLEHLVAAGFL